MRSKISHTEKARMSCRTHCGFEEATIMYKMRKETSIQKAVLLKLSRQGFVGVQDFLVVFLLGVVLCYN